MPQTNSQKLDALTQQKKALAAELAALKKERAKARVDGLSFDNAGRIPEIDAELEEIDEAIVLAEQYVEQDQARAQAANEADNGERSLEELESLRDQYLDAVADVEKAATAFVTAFAEAKTLLPRLDAVAMTVTGSNNIPTLQSGNWINRILGRVAQISADHVPELARGYGMVAADAAKLDPSWRVEEQRLISHVLGTPIMKLRSRIKALRADAGKAME